MRLDKYLAETAQCTRSEAKTMLAKGRVQVNGAVCKKGDTQLKDTDTVVDTIGVEVFVKTKSMVTIQPIVLGMSSCICFMYYFLHNFLLF